jgi:hypothetical protein
MKYIFLIIFIFLNCSIGTKRDQCRYEIMERKPIGCEREFSSIFLIPPRDGNYQRASEGAAILLAYCLLYFEDLKNCDDDNNRFKPGLYGNNQLYPSSEFYLGNNLLSIYRRYSKYNIIKQS